MSSPQQSTYKLKTNWLLIAFVALMPLWTLGLFNRCYWTPDEPREAAIAWRMSVQADQTLPQLGDRPFLEKPPLSYWASAVSMNVFGDSVSAARLPNLIYAIAVMLALGLLVQSMAGNLAATVSTIVAGSAFTAYQVSIWLAPDASLVAGCTIALLGAYRGYQAPNSRDKLLWYAVMHVGALIGFMAKSAPGWIVPALALLVLIVWEKRWRELLSWELWVGFTVQIIGIGIWLAYVLAEPNGVEALRVLFWNNLAGRFTDIQATGALDYASAHKNWPGKYLVELPYHLFPWTLLVVAALFSAWNKTRGLSPNATAWRFAIASCLPFTILLSLATTARGIYLAPAIVGFAMIVGLWSLEVISTQAASLNKVDRFAIKGTRYCVAIFGAILAFALGFVAATERDTPNFWLLIAALICILVLLGVALKFSKLAQQPSPILSSLKWSYVAFAGSLCISSAVLMPIVNTWQDLRPLGAAIKQDTAGLPFALMDPDETTIAMLDYQIRTPFTIMGEETNDEVGLVKQWFDAQGDNSRVLIKLPGHATGKLSQMLQRMGAKSKPLSNGLLTKLEDAKIAELVKIYENPEGRRYALLKAIPK